MGVAPRLHTLSRAVVLMLSQLPDLSGYKLYIMRPRIPSCHLLPHMSYKTIDHTQFRPFRNQSPCAPKVLVQRIVSPPGLLCVVSNLLDDVLYSTLAAPNAFCNSYWVLSRSRNVCHSTFVSENAIVPACSARSLSKIVRKSPISPYGFMPFTLPPIILHIDVSSMVLEYLHNIVYPCYIMLVVVC
jgi:hypothetical protein